MPWARFETMDSLDVRPAQRRDLRGDRLTEADVRVLVTPLRLDLVRFSHFKCNLRRIADYRSLSGSTRDLYRLPAVLTRPLRPRGPPAAVSRPSSDPASRGRRWSRDPWPWRGPRSSP